MAGERDNEITTESYIDFLRLRNLTGNVDMEEVESVDWTDLKGLDDLIEELEARSLCRLRNDSLALELDLKPKRGVLLAVPRERENDHRPRIGASAKGKFFLIGGAP